MSNSFDFVEVAIPARQAGPGRPAEPNPFLDRVAELVDPDGTPRDVAVSFALADEPESEAANRVKRQLARAGIVHNVSIFKRIEPVSSGGSRVTFWAQNRVIPNRRPKGQPVDEAPAAPAADEAPSGVTTLEP